MGRSGLIFTIGTLVSRITGLLRGVLLVGAISTVGLVADAFDIANTLPNMLFTLLAAGVLQAIFMPQIMRALKEDNATERLNKLLTVSISALAIITVALFAASPLLIRLFTLSGTWSPLAIALAVAFAFWCVPQVLGYGIFSLLSEFLTARGQFAAPAWAPVANNLVSIAGFGLFIIRYGQAHGPLNELEYWTSSQTALLAGTATLGVACQVAVMLIALRRGGFRYKVTFGLRGIGLRTAGKVVLWTIAAVLLEQGSVVYLRSMTSAAGQEAAAAGEIAAGNATFTNALTIYLLPHSLVVASIIAVIFPRISWHAANGNHDGVRQSFSTGVRTAGVFAVLATAVLLVFPQAIMKTALPTITLTEVNASAPVLQALAVSLLALGANGLAKTMYYAYADGRSLFYFQALASAVMVAGILISTLTVDSRYWAVAASLAYSVSIWLSLVLRLWGIRRHLGHFDGRRILRLYLRCSIAALLAAGAGWTVGRLMQASGSVPYNSWAHAFALVVVGGLVMALVYVACLMAMRVDELRGAMAPLLRRIKRG